jgi:hypothetical protein
MSLVMILVILVVIGFVMHVINSYVPMASGIKSILNGLVIILVVLWLLQVFGIIHIASLSNMRLH